MDPKNQHIRLYALAGFLAVILLVYLGILFNTQVLDHEEYLAKSVHSIAKEETVSASRGIITDRSGRTLVSNSSAYDLSFDTSLLKDGEDVNQSILRLIQLCQERDMTWVDNLPIRTEAPYAYTVDQLSDTQRGRFLTYLRSLEKAKKTLGNYLLEHPELVSEPEEAQTAGDGSETALTPEKQADALLKRFPSSALTEQVLNSAGLTSAALLEMLCEEFQIPETLSMREQRQVMGVRYELALRRANGYTSCVLTEDIDTEFISLVTDGRYAGAKVTTSSQREYQTTYAAHILGTVGAISSKEELASLGEGYRWDDMVGKSGVEAAFEQYLKGTDGTRVVSVNDEGKITGQYYETEPEPGSTVELTIDLELQKTVEDALAETVSKMTAEDGNAKRGAGAAVVKVGTGEVLALASYPTYDLSTYRQPEVNKALTEDPARPFFNRATQGTYAPGSTFKPLTALAALEEGAVTLTEKINDPGVWYYPEMIEGTEPFKAHCWKRSGHGKLNVTQAITNSCNVFFYEMGYRLGIDALNKYASAFGLGENTGIEIGDSAGVLAGREEREASGGVWYGGETTQAAIGQSDNLFTPLQLANYIATLVSGGKHCQAHLLKAVKAYDNSEVVAVGNTQPVNTVEFSDSTLQAIKEGMLGYTQPGGMVYSSFKDCTVTAGAKTGTAQLGGNVKNNGVFVCFAPYDEPEIALAIVIEQGDAGAALASTAVTILNSYFSADEIGTAVIGENQLLP
ncbi:penicillin-binding protein A [Oscillibacter valericigenes]|uniref:penicillin-binding transpeptidase domain-containing protein n=1 Tax=Oscillibacter valericigenes TaxID=351091 RepID=UPI001F3A7B63|nr:penicillin-binding transpeptidase domain-containing protein [Oscillibacter valericigenes]MCF2616229.1 penicillin-binding protein A [Oscillibacter valericigenes]